MRIHHIHFDSHESTMEAARREAPGYDFLLITADIQTRGRGSKGRPWHSPKGNVYLTLAVHKNFLPPNRLRLFPLEVGLVLWESAAACVSPVHRPLLHLKWPNDLLLGKRKTAGMLLESAGEHMLIGLGVNIVEAPLISDGGSHSACLTEAEADSHCGPLLASIFSETIQESVVKPQSENILEEWKEKALWNNPFRLRDRPGQPQVLPVDVNSDGHLRIRFEDGHEEWLVSEYLA